MTASPTWLGRPLDQPPERLIALQALIWEVQPDVVVVTGSDQITLLHGATSSPDLVRRVSQETPEPERALVVLGSDPVHALDEFIIWSPLVQPGSYVVLAGGEHVEPIVAATDRFVVDPRAPSRWLRCVGDVPRRRAPRRRAAPSLLTTLDSVPVVTFAAGARGLGTGVILGLAGGVLVQIQVKRESGGPHAHADRAQGLQPRGVDHGISHDSEPPGVRRGDDSGESLGSRCDVWTDSGVRQLQDAASAETCVPSAPRTAARWLMRVYAAYEQRAKGRHR